MKSPIHTRKHYVQWTLATVATTDRTNLIISKGIRQIDVNAPDEVVEGAVVKAVFVELWTISSSSDGSEIVLITKNQGLSGITYAESVALDTWDNKRNILHTHQGLSSNDGIAAPSLAFRGWIKIPKGKQRQALGDIIHCTVSNPSANTLTYCGFATYKEYL